MQGGGSEYLWVNHLGHNIMLRVYAADKVQACAANSLAVPSRDSRCATARSVSAPTIALLALLALRARCKYYSL